MQEEQWTRIVLPQSFCAFPSPPPRRRSFSCTATVVSKEKTLTARTSQLASIWLAKLRRRLFPLMTY
ncbi:hypothetical protein WJX73_004033 [Symbiochloris irregularis]|uniref:Uncharacterized protein n=1 Tax=Symbiochloris irregularis TaxID=706552 RepID=A0AAW1PBC2_9CHLO